MTHNFPRLTDSNKDLNYHTVPMLVVFSLGENLSRRQRAERPEGFLRNLNKAAWVNLCPSPQDKSNSVGFIAKLHAAYVKAARAIRSLSGSKHQDA